MNKSDTKKLARGAMVAALYVLLSLIFAPVSYGVIQFRIAEALVILCIYSKSMVYAVALGCLISNLIGFIMGVNPIMLDIFFGTAATFVAGMLSYKLGRFRIGSVPLLAAIPPIVINAIVIGAELTLLETGSIFASGSLYFINALYIAVSEAVPCVIGLVLVVALEKTGVAKKFYGSDVDGA